MTLTERLETAMRKGEGKRLLVLDDDPSLQELITIVAKDFDIQIVSAHTSGEAHDLMEQQGPFDLAILDVNVANGSGISLYRWILETFPRQSVAFFTGFSSAELERKIHTLGSAPIYSKPLAFTVPFLRDFLTKLGARRMAAT